MKTAMTCSHCGFEIEICIVCMSAITKIGLCPTCQDNVICPQCGQQETAAPMLVFRDNEVVSDV